ncbi:MAG: 3'-5' exonuclease, partial [Hungatella sp.]
ALALAVIALLEKEVSIRNYFLSKLNTYNVVKNILLKFFVVLDIYILKSFDCCVSFIFDYSFLKRAAVNGGLTFEKKGIDTLLLCREFMPAEVKKNLAVACRYYQVENQHAHRALSDAYAAHELYQKMLLQHGIQKPRAFEDKFLIYKVKKEQFATKRQKEGLRELIKYHKIDITVQIEHLSRNEISRMTDKIISQYGRIVKR